MNALITKESLKPAIDQLVGVSIPKATIEREMLYFTGIVNASNDLLSTDIKSRLECFVKALSWGLSFNTSAPDVYLISRWVGPNVPKTCNLMPRYTGLAKLAVRDGGMKNIRAKVVYEGDEIDYDSASAEKVLSHKPAAIMGREPGKVIAVYCIGEMEDGTRLDEVMSIAEVYKVARDRSEAWKAKLKAGENARPTVWDTDLPEMACKTVIKRFCKKIPLLPEPAKEMIAADHQDYKLEPSHSQLAMIEGLRGMSGLSPEEDEGLENILNEDFSAKTATRIIKRLQDRIHEQFTEAMNAFGLGLEARIIWDDKEYEIESINHFGFLELRRILSDNTPGQQTKKITLHDIQEHGLTEAA